MTTFFLLGAGAKSSNVSVVTQKENIVAVSNETSQIFPVKNQPNTSNTIQETCQIEPTSNFAGIPRTHTYTHRSLSLSQFHEILLLLSVVLNFLS
jgi:hypothetical protein